MDGNFSSPKKPPSLAFFFVVFGRVMGLQRECRAKGEKLATNVMYRRICTLMMRTIKIYGVSVAFMAILIDLLRGKGNETPIAFLGDIDDGARRASLPYRRRSPSLLGVMGMRPKIRRRFNRAKMNRRKIARRLVYRSTHRTRRYACVSLRYPASR